MKPHPYSPHVLPTRWPQLATAIILASLCLITLLALLQAKPAAANGPFPIVTVILQEGDTPPIGGGLPVAFLNSPVTNGNGQVSFSGALENGSDDTEFIWYDTALTWLSNGLISDVLSIENVMGISNNGNYVMSLLLDPNSVDSVWTDDGLLIAEGDPAPGIPGYYVVSVSRPTMQTNGLVNWFATISDTPGGTAQLEVLYHASDVSAPTINPILQGGDVIGSATLGNMGLDLDYFVSDNGNHLVTLVQTTEPVTQDEYIYLDDALVLREGEATGEGDNWDNFDLLQVNNSGNYVMSGDTDGSAASNAFIAYNGLIQVREGDTVGGVLLSSTANVRQLSLNNAGQAAYTWSVLGGREILFFACDAADLASATAVLGTNDLVDTNGDGTADATITDFNTAVASQSFMLAEDGQIYVEVDLDYGSGSLEAIINYALPSCTGNMPPVAVGDSYTTTQATPLVMPAPGVLANDTDAEGDPLTAVLIQTTSHGNLTLNSDGSFTYAPNPPYFGTDSFTYRAHDGISTSNLATVVIDIDSNNSEPGLQISPVSLESSQPVNTLVTKTLTISNTGDSNVSWEINAGPILTYESGPLVNLPGGGLNGADASVLQNNSLGMAVLGFGNSLAGNDRLADEFTITDTEGWFVDKLTFYTYQTDSPITSTITAVNFQIWDGLPSVPTSTVIFGDTTTNRLAQTTWSGVYRVSETANTSRRPIMANTVAVGTFLTPGTYWLDWVTAGSNSFTGPWAPPIVISNVITTGNSLQLSGGIWIPATDTGIDSGGNTIGTHAPQGLPFQIMGNIGDCQSLDWVTVSPDSDTLPPGALEQVAVTFNSTGLAPGTYTGSLCLTSDDSNNAFIRVPLTLTNLAPSVVLTTTIGLVANECATHTTLYTPDPVTAYYCYTITNNGTVTLTQHDLEDSHFGSILSGHVAELAPGASLNTVSIVPPLQVTINANTVTTATWIASNTVSMDVISATDTAAVIVGTPGLILEATVGALPSLCATESEIAVPMSTTVYYCYTVTNSGDIPLAVHSLSESAFGSIFSTYDRILNPGESFNTVAEGITHTVQVMEDIVSTAVWTATSGPLININATATTAVNAYIINTTHLPFIIRP